MPFVRKFNFIVTRGVIFDIKRFAVHDGPGIRTTIFLKGCPLSCWWCHNPESRSDEPQQSVRHLTLEGGIFDKEEITGYEVGIDEIIQQVERDRIFYEESGGGVTLSGGEPLNQPQFCRELLRSLKTSGFHTALDTTGYAPEEDIHSVMPFTDLFLYDLKLMDETEHLKYTGVSNKGILENLELLFEEKKNVIIRFPVIPGITDTPTNINAIIDFLKSIQQCRNTQPPYLPTSPPPYLLTSLPEIHLLPYHNTATNKYKRFQMDNTMSPVPSVSSETINQVRKSFADAGFQVKVGG